MASFSTVDSARAPHAGLPVQASRAPHQLLTCRMVSPVSCASCFFCSSEGYGCCGHQQESSCLQGCHLIPKAWPAPAPRGWRAQTGTGAGKANSSELLRAPQGPNRGKRSQALSNYACRSPRLFQQLEANWPALFRKRQSLGTGLHSWERRQNPAQLSESQSGLLSPCPNCFLSLWLSLTVSDSVSPCLLH